MKNLSGQVYKPYLHIISGFPGTGKSYHVMYNLVPKFIAEGKRVLYLLPSHDRVDEFYEKMVPPARYVGAKEVKVKRTTSIWRGLKRICPIYQVYLEQVSNLKRLHQKCHIRHTVPCGPIDTFISQPIERIIYSILYRLYFTGKSSEQVEKQLITILEAINCGLPASIVCPVCQKLELTKKLNLDCSYRKQFSTRKKLVLTVHDYLITSYPKEFDVIIADDLSLLKSITFSPPSREEYYRILETFMVLLDAHKDSKELLDILGGQENLRKLRGTINEAIKIESMKRSLDKLIEGFREILGTEWFSRSFRSWARLFSGLSRIFLEHMDLEYAIGFFKLSLFLQWLYYYSIYKKIQAYSRPYLFYLSDLLLEGKEVYLISANFTSRDTIKLFERLLELYRLENGITEDISYQIEYLEPPNGPKGVVYFYLKVFEDSVTGRYPTKSIKQYKTTLERILTRVRWLLKHYRLPPDGEGLGIVTGKDLVEYVKNAFPKAEVIHYYNLEGSNKLADVKLLVLIGTPEIGKENLVDMAKTLFPNYDFGNTEAIYEGPLLGYRYRDPLLDNLNSVIVDMEMFQAIHRARSIRRGVDVYVFGKPIAVVEDVGLEARWFDITERALYCRPMYNFEQITFGYRLIITPHRKKLKVYGDIEKLKHFLHHLNCRLSVGGEFTITYMPGTNEVRVEEKKRYHRLG